MINIEKDFSLKKLNTFGIEAIAREYVRITTTEELKSFILSGIPENRLIIGGGSNLLFTGDPDGMIIHPDIKGISILRQDEETADIAAACGENWDSFVGYCCRNEFSGLENLSLIPGNVGAAPVQNIGAYGVEAKDRILWVEGFDPETGEFQRMRRDDCRFGYRTSIFKQQMSNRFIITTVAFRLDKKPRFVLSYGNVEEEFRKKELQNSAALRECIIQIRKSKLPDPELFGNAGSFFKNPVISHIRFSKLKAMFPGIPSYPDGQCIKIPAAWLIEKAGWKGVKEKNTGTWPAQPLVIVNYGNATGSEIFEFSLKIMNAVREKFGIELESEVKVI